MTLSLRSVLLLISVAFLGAMIFILKKERPHIRSQLACEKHFDAGYYRALYPEIVEKDLTPFVHYMIRGYKEYKNPSSRFDARFYEKIYLTGHRGELGGVTENPLVHWTHHSENITHPKLVKKETFLKKTKLFNL